MFIWKIFNGQFPVDFPKGIAPSRKLNHLLPQVYGGCACAKSCIPGWLKPIMGCSSHRMVLLCTITNLGWLKPYKSWDDYHLSTGDERISQRPIHPHVASFSSQRSLIGALTSPRENLQGALWRQSCSAFGQRGEASQCRTPRCGGF